MHRVSGTNCPVDAIVMLTRPKVCSTKTITISISTSMQKLSSTPITRSCYQLARFAGKLQTLSSLLGKSGECCYRSPTLLGKLGELCHQSPNLLGGVGELCPQSPILHVKMQGLCCQLVSSPGKLHKTWPEARWVWTCRAEAGQAAGGRHFSEVNMLWCACFC